MRSLVVSNERLAWVDDRLGGRIPPKLLQSTLLGHRIIIAIEPAEKVSPGGIIIPDAARDSGGAGFIIAIGQDVGAGTGGYDPWFPDAETREAWFKEQRNLLGSHIVYGKFALWSLRMDLRDRDFETNFGIIHAKDVWLFQNDENGWVIPPKENDNV